MSANFLFCFEVVKEKTLTKQFSLNFMTIHQTRNKPSNGQLSFDR